MKFQLSREDRPRDLVIPCLLGLESVVGDELRFLGVEPAKIRQTNGQVYIAIDEAGTAAEWAETFNHLLYLTNLGLGSAERVQVELCDEPCESFEAVYEIARALPWEVYIEEGNFIHLSGWSRKSRIYGIPSCQSIVKKAIIDRLNEAAGRPAGTRIPEDPEAGEARVQIVLQNDRMSLRLDTSGEGLHKRGYRLEQGEAPLKETLASAILKLSFWPRNRGEGLYDPFCGSGTFAIEAARQVEGIAPGSLRNFTFEAWPENDPGLREACLSIPRPEERPGPILASDVDPEVLNMARRNAERAGVAGKIRFFQQDILTDSFFSIPEMDEATPFLIVGNPPYGERLEEELEPLHQALRRQLFDERGILPRRRLSIITAAEDFEQQLGFMADKRRKLYNGMILSPMYHYFKAGRNKPFTGESGGSRNARNRRR